MDIDSIGPLFVENSMAVAGVAPIRDITSSGTFARNVRCRSWTVGDFLNDRIQERQVCIRLIFSTDPPCSCRWRLYRAGRSATEPLSGEDFLLNLAPCLIWFPNQNRGFFQG